MPPAKHWSPNPRQQAVLDEVRARGSVSVERLAQRLDVTMQTVRRDVQRLADAGLLLRFHGGVSLPRESPAAAAWKERQAMQANAKARIAKSVAAAIPEGSSLMLSIGTTVEAVARELMSKNGLQIVTHNLHVASLLSEHPDCKVHLTGGMLRGRDGALEGDHTVSYLQQFKVDVAIITALAIDEEGNLRDRDLRELPAAQAMMSQAKQTWLVADVSKFNQSALAKVSHLKDVKRIFTEALPPAPFPQLFQELGISLTIAS